MIRASLSAGTSAGCSACGRLAVGRVGLGVDTAGICLTKGELVKHYRLGLLTNMPTPYRLPLFQALSEQPDLSLSVAFNTRLERNRQWNLPDRFDFEYEILPGRTLSVFRKDLVSHHVNWGIGRWLEKGKFDAVVVGGWSSAAQQLAVLMCRRRGIPVILWSGSVAHYSGGAARTLTRPLVRRLVRWSDAYIAYGSASKRYLVELGAQEERIIVSFNTVDVEWWAEAARGGATEWRQESPGRVTILYVGQLIARKGLETLIDALNLARLRVPQLRLMLVGAGPLEDALRARVHGLGLEGVVSFERYVQSQDLVRYYAKADLVVLPSTDEVWGLTINEAMASARPVIASSAVGAAEDLIVHGETGWITPPSDARKLASNFIQFASLPWEQRRDMGIAAQQRILSEFTLEQNVAAFRRALELSLPRANVGVRQA